MLMKQQQIYPNRSCLLTGPEYILAKKQGCNIEMNSVFYIPPTEESSVKEKSFVLIRVIKKDGDRKVVLIQPLHNIIKEIQRLIKETPPKKNFMIVYINKWVINSMGML